MATTVGPFEECSLVDQIVLVVSQEDVERCWQLVRDEGWTKVAAVKEGGPRRQDSVAQGLRALSPCQWVVVHDGARPLVSVQLIQAGLEAARETGAAVAGVPVVDTIKVVGEGDLVGDTPPRESLRAVQTPQVFRYDLLRQAHYQVTQDVSDDAAMVEALGHRVRVYPGSPTNIKITTPGDLTVAELFLKIRASVG